MFQWKIISPWTGCWIFAFFAFGVEFTERAVNFIFKQFKSLQERNSQKLPFNARHTIFVEFISKRIESSLSICFRIERISIPHHKPGRYLHFVWLKSDVEACKRLKMFLLQLIPASTRIIWYPCSPVRAFVKKHETNSHVKPSIFKIYSHALRKSCPNHSYQWRKRRLFDSLMKRQWTRC